MDWAVEVSGPMVFDIVGDIAGGDGRELAGGDGGGLAGSGGGGEDSAGAAIEDNTGGGNERTACGGEDGLAGGGDKLAIERAGDGTTENAINKTSDQNSIKLAMSRLAKIICALRLVRLPEVDAYTHDL